MRTGRRKFLALAGGASLLAMPWARAVVEAASQSPAPRLLVLVYLKGGNDAYNTLVPFGNARYVKHRPTIALKRDQVIRITDSHGFHPALGGIMPIWETRELALIQGIGQQEITNQHYRDAEMQFTGASPDQYLTDGWATRAMIANRRQGKALDALAFGDLDIREADPMGPFRGNKLRVINMQHPSEWLRRHQVTGTRYLTSAPAQESAGRFALSSPAELKTVFPADEFGEALMATVQLAVAGVAPPVVHITLNAASGDQHHAFDTHWDQLKYHGLALERLARGIAAFREGMREIGQWDNTLLATYDEFGRSPKENADRGTHHGWSSVHFVAGGKVKGGLYGEAMPVIDVFSIDGPPPVIDYRALYTTIIEKWWGGSAAGVFDRRFLPLDLLRA